MVLINPKIVNNSILRAASFLMNYEHKMSLIDILFMNLLTAWQTDLLSLILSMSRQNKTQILRRMNRNSDTLCQLLIKRIQIFEEEAAVEDIQLSG